MSRPYVITFPSSVREGGGRVGVVITNIIRIVPHEKNPETSILFMVDRSATLVDMTIDQVRDAINTFLGLPS
jgi:hypothetical protein